MESSVRPSQRAETLSRQEVLPPILERRRFKRIQSALSVALTSETNFYMGLTQDLSEGGMFVATHLTEPIGSRVVLTVELGDGGPSLVAQGVVRWLREVPHPGMGEMLDHLPPGMGVMLEDLDEEQRERIRGFMRTRAPEFFGD